MALIQSHGTCGVYSEQADSEHQQASGGLGHSAEIRTQASASTSPECAASLIKRQKQKNKGTVVSQRATLSLSAVLDDGTNVEVKYHARLETALAHLFHVNLFDVPTCLQCSITVNNLPHLLEVVNAPQSTIFYFKKGLLKRVKFFGVESLLTFPLNFLVKQGKVYLIKEVNETNKCEYCGSFFKVSHTCTLRRRDFYFHHVSGHTADWWEKIPFKPLGAPRETQRVYLVYDIETYTWHGSFGKQLVPFMLVFKVFGDPALSSLIISLVKQEQWFEWEEPNIFYLITPEKKTIGLKFKKLRDLIQQKIASSFWSSVLQLNPHLEKESRKLGLACSEDLSPEQLAKMKLKGPPQFIEVYIIGHNITGFDEIVLAAQVISARTEIPAVFQITRNFMPRSGRLLFNDITYSLPNPDYKARQDYEDWEQGIFLSSDSKTQYIKFMIRDTYTLTHTSLQNAAKAYSLTNNKGSCPYQAINDFYMFGTYQQDPDGFPALHYWKNAEEYTLNKEIWGEKKQDAYDIIQHTLDYCALDVKVTAELVLKLIESYQDFIQQAVNLPSCSFHIFQRPTISSNSHAIFKQILYRNEKPNQQNMAALLLAPSKEMYDYVRSSIRGGRCYPTYIGIYSEPIFVYDICGMYASALTHPMPSGMPLNPFERALAVRAYEVKLKKAGCLIDYFDPDLLPGIFTIDADPPPSESLDVLPPFCSKKGGRLCWTNEPLRGEIATSIDVITLHNRKWRVRIVPDSRTIIFPEWKCLAREYVQLNIQAKEQADKNKNQTMRSIAKLLSNALYGSFATKLDNKKIVFSDQLEHQTIKEIASGAYVVKSSSYIETDNLSAEVLPEFVVAYPPLSSAASAKSSSGNTDDEEEEAPPFMPPTSMTSYVYKPITFLDAEENDFCLHTLEKSSPLITNNRYSSQIASFVLAWTRAFMSEWSQFLYDSDVGIPLEERQIKSVYGDTDSMFVTQKGYQLMEQKGKKRLKKNGGPLVFDPEHPQLTWLVECETQCEKCGADAYSPESVFLAPKLYALKSVVCTVCNHVGKGKLRAKGHATSDLSYDILSACYYADVQQGTEKFQTSRMSLRRTLASVQAHVQPFTVTETTLTRTLRPWKDKTLFALDLHRLVPYSRQHPNPRNTEVTWMELPWMT
ncbi:DNA polymerase [Skunk adenovirus HUN/2009]|nr:DNA polymerase [Skunk adenovirus HUN/2009]